MAQKAYECDNCNEVHDRYYAAEKCCQPEVNTVWLCEICEEAHYEESDAETCCADKNVEGQLVTCPNCLRGHDVAAETLSIEIGGHCSVCNPFFTVEQKLRISDCLDDLEVERQLRI